MLVLSISMYAQREVTKFLGIPVDGTKSEMIRELKAKGFKKDYDSVSDLKGEFNGREVDLSVMTNKDKVWRIVVSDVSLLDETQIKIRFNKLCQQFRNNPKYIVVKDVIISNDECLSDNIDSYEAAYYQKQGSFNVYDSQRIRDLCMVKYGTKKIKDLSEEQRENLYREYVDEDALGHQKRLVWFKIVKIQLGESVMYSLAMYYENGYNEANGEDL